MAALKQPVEIVLVEDSLTTPLFLCMPWPRLA